MSDDPDHDQVVGEARREFSEVAFTPNRTSFHSKSMGRCALHHLFQSLYYLINHLIRTQDSPPM